MKNTLVVILSCSIAMLLAQGKKVSLEDVWKRYSFYAPALHDVASMKDGLHYTAISNADGNSPTIEKFSYASGESVGYVISTRLIEEQTGKSINFDTYQFSPDESKVLLGTDTESIYRHSTKSKYYVYDLQSGALDSLNAPGKQQLATFSPTRNQVAFVYNNRLHIQDFESNNRELISFGKGEDDAYIAGAVDWVYEEEFSFDKGFAWSPEGNYIAYYQFDEREVPLFTMDVFGMELYPSESEFKYPKAGEMNSQVEIHVFDVKNKEDKKVNIPTSYEYIPRIKWTGAESGKLVVFSMNRLQNHLQLWSVQPQSAEASLLYEEKAPAYLEIHDNLRFLKDGSFIWTSEKSGYNHIYHLDKKGKEIRQLTSGNWDVTEFYGVDEDQKVVYYQAAEESPMQRSVYRIKLNGKGKQKLSKQKGWNAAEFSDGFKYYINTFSSLTQPTTQTLHDGSGKMIRMVNDNQALQNRLKEYNLAATEFFQFSTAAGTPLNGWMMKPANFDPAVKYPVLMFVYGGPGSQTVKDQYDGFNHFWYQTLADKGYIIVSVDNRGTGARGRDFRTSTYEQLGKHETEDQIEAARYLGSLDYVDASRIGIWGWSYGGYMSSLALSKGSDEFKMAMAVAPVTNWRFYDSIYTERYMGLPKDNAAGYDDNSPINHVAKMEGAFLLVHGSADDNVHFQNTMRMVEALVQANKQFDMFVYPDKNHGIFGGNTRFHLYTKMTDFITENL